MASHKCSFIFISDLTFLQNPLRSQRQKHSNENGLKIDFSLLVSPYFKGQKGGSEVCAGVCSSYIYRPAGEVKKKKDDEI